MNIVRSCMAGITLAALALPAMATPKIGDKAPPVKVSDWMAAKPPALPGEKGADKHVFLVEFWATWCGPCRRSIPHLAKLHRAREKDGLVIIGVSNEDKPTVEGFVKGKGGKKGMDMPYFVGVDDDMGTNSKYMDEIEGIPHSFLVDRSGVVVWAGNPLDSEALDKAIDLTLAGKYDVEKAKKAAEAGKKFTRLMNELQVAYQGKDEKKIFQLLDQMIETKPDDLQGYLIKRHMLGEFNKREQISSVDAALEAAIKDSPDSLKDLVGHMLGREPSERNAGMMYRSAVRADQLAGGKSAECAAILSSVYCQLGMLEAAIKTQERATELAAAEEKDTYKSVLKYLNEAKEIARTAPAAQTGS